jgi:hypothetical protein
MLKRITGLARYSTKGQPPPAEGFMHGLTESQYLKHTKEQAINNPELKLRDSSSNSCSGNQEIEPISICE